ncbi:hypothetical protein AB0878_46245 [Amycolatopsis sp. NPDC047767]|uniref:hypothetical protein n=1 Tax=Amycolatopsis sp. NPDC047767 TaxID=3156765 RepID=UPI0034547987
MRGVAEQLADTAEILHSYAADLETGVVNEPQTAPPAAENPRPAQRIRGLRKR